jgi:hypothetical protein
MWTTLISLGLDLVVEYAKPLLMGLATLIGGFFLYRKGKSNAKQEIRTKGLEDALDANIRRKEIDQDLAGASRKSKLDRLRRWRNIR